MFIYMIYLCCVSSRRPSDVGCTLTNCSYTLLIIGNTEPKSVYSTVELRWLELVGTVGASSTHPCVRAIHSLPIFKLVHVY